jgi:uncharacterized protein YndB with AHSA1/START domain
LTTENSTETLRIRRIVPATKERLFRAWTEPNQVTRWWTIGEGWKAEFAEIDLRVGGKFKVGNKPRAGEPILLTGEFLEVEPPDKLVYTWRFGATNPEESVITVEFNEVGDQTEVLITHEHSSKEMGPGAVAGWESALASLARFVERL